MTKKTIAYLVIGENPISGIFRSQLYEPYRRLVTGFHIKIFFLVNPYLWLKNREEISILRGSLKDIEIVIVPFQLVPERYMRLGSLPTRIGNCWNRLVLKILDVANILTADIAVARSYFAAHALSENVLRGSVKVFDPRSIYPLERYSHGYLRSKGLYEYWLLWEREKIGSFNTVITVSRGMTNYYTKFNNSISEIVLSSGMKARQVLNRPSINGSLRLVYWGSMVYSSHNNSWLHYETRLRQLSDLIDIKIIIDFFVPSIDKRIPHRNLGDNLEIRLIKGLSDLEITKYHGAIYFIPDSLDSFSRLGIKTVEYLSQNLPIIFDSGMSEYVSELLIQNSAGCDIEDISLELLQSFLNDPLKVYHENFNPHWSLKKLKNLYENIGSKNY
tara:strand:- start:706 stop:1869 length:1164 start_codon:yes stop_codon:yes gene_type:complete